MMLANARADLLGFPSGVAGSESADDRVRRALMNASGSDGPAPPWGRLAARIVAGWCDARLRAGSDVLSG